MIVRPAIDIREGQCVQLIGGSYDEELIRLPNPVAVAQDWVMRGFSYLHVIDLDRATNRGSNIAVVTDLLSNIDGDINIRVGGGVRSNQDIEEILNIGASSVVVGSKAVKEPEWFRKATIEFPSQLYVALEVDGREVKVDGWQTAAEGSLDELIETFNECELAGIFVTAIHKEGRRQGTDLELFKHIRALTDHDIVASGGVTTADDIKELKALEIDEVVLGAAIYTDPNLVSTLQEDNNRGRQP